MCQHDREYLISMISLGGVFASTHGQHLMEPSWCEYQSQPYSFSGYEQLEHECTWANHLW